MHCDERNELWEGYNEALTTLLECAQQLETANPAALKRVPSARLEGPCGRDPCLDNSSNSYALVTRRAQSTRLA